MSAADYSDARPGGAALRAAGITSVGRYLAPPGDPRALELPEYQDLRAHGIDVWVNREGASTDMLGGYAKGVYHGQTAAANLARLGIPLDAAFVYASADFDVQDSQLPICDAYMDGFQSILGAAGEAIYGGMKIINHFRANGKAKRFWKSASTSWDHGETGFVHIEQTLAPSLAGTDNDILHAADYGQIGASPTPTITEEDMSYSIVPFAGGPDIYVVSQVTGLYAHVTQVGHVALLQRLKKNDNNDPMLQAEIDVCKSYLAQINPAPVVPVPVVDVQALATALVADLPADPTPPTVDAIAAAVVAALPAGTLTVDSISQGVRDKLASDPLK